jgi:hypothetical protein
MDIIASEILCGGTPTKGMIACPLTILAIGTPANPIDSE